MGIRRLIDCAWLANDQLREGTVRRAARGFAMMLKRPWEACTFR